MKDTFKINRLPYSIVLGKTGENIFRSIRIDMSAWLYEYPDAAVSIIYRRPDGMCYTPSAELTHKVLEWKPNATDLAVKGTGYLELHLTSGDVIGKSSVINIRVEESIEPDGEVPEPYESWYEDVLAASQDAQDARDTAVAALADKQDKLTAGSNITIEDDVISSADTTDHREMSNRDAADQHPISAISGLQSALDAKGSYSRPSDGIPKSDLSSTVRTSLDKAESALQQHQSLAAYRTSSAQDSIDAGKLGIVQGHENAGKFLIVGSSGNITLAAYDVLTGGSY